MLRKFCSTGVTLMIAQAFGCALAASPLELPAGGAADGQGANAVTQAAVQQGIMTCAARINHVTNFLGYAPPMGVLLMVPPTLPDQHLVPLAMEAPLGSTDGLAYVSATFAPNQANGCGAAYEAVVYWPTPCDAVQVRQFAGLKKVGYLKTDIAVLDGGVATKVFLLPAGAGCVSIKKEMVL